MDKNFIGVIILLVLVAGVSGALYFRDLNESGGMKIDIPIEIAEWKARDIPLDERTYAILETRNVIMRDYSDVNDRSIYLYIVASEANRRVAHPPEVCYTGDGVEILGKEEIRFRVQGLEEPLVVNSFVSRKGGKDSLVYYWYKSGDRFTAHYISLQAKAVLNQMAGKPISSALIRVSTSIDGNKQKATQILQEFSKKLIPLILEHTP